MKLFSKLSINDYVYSDILAIAYKNPSFFAFLDVEKNRYVMNDLVFHNLIKIEAERLKINFKDISNIIIEHDWDMLKKVVDIAIKLRSLVYSDDISITVRDNSVYLINDSTPFLFSPLMFVENVEMIYPENYHDIRNEWLCMKTDLISQYLKDEYVDKYKSFFTVIKERGQELCDVYDTDIYTSLGVRFDLLPNLYYKSLKTLDIDILKTPEMFKTIEYKKVLEDINKTYLTKLKDTELTFTNEIYNYYTYIEHLDKIIYIPQLENYTVCTDKEYSRLIFKFRFSDFAYLIEHDINENYISYRIIS